MEECQKQNVEKLKKKSKISLEDYIDFFFSNKQLVLPILHLKQIIRMHGYRSLYPKKVLTDAISTIDLINPCRSTLEESISSSASIPLQDLIFDLKDLDWQECCVTSVLTFSSLNQNSFSSVLDHQELNSKPKAHESEIIGDVSSSALISSYRASEKPGRKLERKNKKNKTSARNSVKDGSLDHSSFMPSVSLGSN